MIVNLYEEAVRRRAKDVMQQLGMCECEMCFDDVCTLTLNNLPPRYVSSTGGEVFSQLAINTEQGQAEFMTALYVSAKKIHDRPRHAAK